MPYFDSVEFSQVSVEDHALVPNEQDFGVDAFAENCDVLAHKLLRSQFVTSSSGHGGRRYLPNAFTEHGAIMAASVLNSERADEMSIFVVRAFVRMREALASNQKIMAKLAELEHRVESHDTNIQELIEAIRELMEPLPATGRRIGFALPSAAKDSAKSLNSRNNTRRV